METFALYNIDMHFILGKINWCRHLRSRTEYPIEGIRKRCNILDTDLGKKILQKYKKIHASLVKYENDTHKLWFQEVCII